MNRVVPGEHKASSEERRRQVSPLCLLLGLALSASLLCAAQDITKPSQVTNPIPPLSQPMLEGSAKGENEVRTRPSEPDSGPCVANADHLQLIYPKVHASFVGGTISGMPLARGTLRRLNMFQTDQFRVEGSLAMGPCNIVFTFGTRTNQKPEADADSLYKILPCRPPGAAVLSREATQLCQLENSTGGSGKTRYVIQVPYGQVNVLARGRKGAGELNADTAAYLTAATAVLTTIIGTVSSTQSKEVYGGATVFAGALAYFFLIKRPSEGENYMAVFVRKAGGEGKMVSPEGGVGKQSVSPGNQPLLQKGDVIIFRIPNYHDYFNISMILNGKTGLEFVSQDAEKKGN